MVIILPVRGLYTIMCSHTEFSGYFLFFFLHSYNHTIATNLHLGFHLTFSYKHFPIFCLCFIINILKSKWQSESIVPGLLSPPFWAFSATWIEPLSLLQSFASERCKSKEWLSTLLPWLGRTLTTHVLPTKCSTLAFVPGEDQYMSQMLLNEAWMDTSPRSLTPLLRILYHCCWWNRLMKKLMSLTQKTSPDHSQSVFICYGLFGHLRAAVNFGLNWQNLRFGKLVHRPNHKPSQTQ